MLKYSLKSDSRVFGASPAINLTVADNSKMNGHANGSLTAASKTEAELDCRSDATTQAALPQQAVQAKASVLEVFKKVRRFSVPRPPSTLDAGPAVSVWTLAQVIDGGLTCPSDLGDGLLCDLRVLRHSVRVPGRHCGCSNHISWKMG